MKRRKLFVFMLDALATYDIESMKSMSNFAWMFEKGSYIKHVEPIYPSYTYPCHCSIITGNRVKKIGVPHNAKVEVENANAPWYNQRSDIKCPTIFDYAARAGMVTCSLSWPVTGGDRNIKLNMPMIVPAKYIGDDPGQFLVNNASDELMDRYFFYRPKTHPTSSERLRPVILSTFTLEAPSFLQRPMPASRQR